MQHRRKLPKVLTALAVGTVGLSLIPASPAAADGGPWVAGLYYGNAVSVESAGGYSYSVNSDPYTDVWGPRCKLDKGQPATLQWRVVKGMVAREYTDDNQVMNYENRKVFASGSRKAPAEDRALTYIPLNLTSVKIADTAKWEENYDGGGYTVVWRCVNSDGSVQAPPDDGGYPADSANWKPSDWRDGVKPLTSSLKRVVKPGANLNLSVNFRYFNEYGDGAYSKSPLTLAANEALYSSSVIGERGNVFTPGEALDVWFAPDNGSNPTRIGTIKATAARSLNASVTFPQDLPDARGALIVVSNKSHEITEASTAEMPEMRNWIHASVVVPSVEVSKTGKSTGGDTEPTTPVTAGWVQSGGRWWYRNADGSYPRGTWQQINGYWYLFDAAGYMLTGWQRVGGNWYYLGADGSMKTGWQSVGGAWYYLRSSGAMSTGWQNIDGTWYLFNGSGAMYTHWQQVGARWYYLGGNGAMRTGWQYIGGAWFYLGGSGAMATSWQYVNGSWYYFGGNGAMRTGWQSLSGYWYYLGGNGAMRTGWQSIGGGWYYFYSSGVMARSTVIDGYTLSASGLMVQGGGSTSTGGSTTTYRNCTDVWNRLGRPIRWTDPGYGSHLDRDGDGTGCEVDPR